MDKECIEILKDCGLNRRRAEELSGKLEESLKFRGFSKKEEKIKKTKQVSVIKDFTEIDNTYLEEDYKIGGEK